jgi:murein DD-endopeptidase MepM/ murein hydrolase activator NlpD
MRGLLGFLLVLVIAGAAVWFLWGQDLGLTPKPVPAAGTEPQPNPGAGPAPPAEPVVPADDGGAEQPASEPQPEPQGPAGPDSPAPAGPSFARYDTADLIPTSGSGYADRALWAEGICFPIKAKAFANSQVWGKGGYKGPPGGQCAESNYDYPWRDNFCEARSRTNRFCGSSAGHQGQDIRPESCKAKVWQAVAVDDGVISKIGSYSVYLKSDKAARTYVYLHLDRASVVAKWKVGDHLKRGDVVGLVSNDFGGELTTIHLHFEVLADVSTALNDGTLAGARLAAPPYSSLVAAYERKLAGTDTGCS